jgi:hypothetical protein
LWIYVANKHGNADVERDEEEAKDLEIITNETDLLWAQYLLQVFFIFFFAAWNFFLPRCKISPKKNQSLVVGNYV